MAAYTLLTAALVYAVFAEGGVAVRDWVWTTLTVSIAVALYARTAPPLPGFLRWPLLLLPAWILVQVIPLPAVLLRIISPARAEIAGAMASIVPVSEWIPISVAPAATLQEFLRVAVAVLALLLMRELAWRYPERPWLLAAPLVGIAALEAVLGIVQFYTGAEVAGEVVAHGTYANRDHFAGLLEMALPFPIMHAVAAVRKRRVRGRSPMRPAIAACFSLTVATLLLVGSILCLSRTGFIVALLAIAICLPSVVRECSPGSRAVRFRLSVPAATLLLAGALFVYLAPDRLIARFAQASATGSVPVQDRIGLWRETLPLIAAYPFTGCGLGGYESAFSRFKASAPLNSDAYTHNDYLQNLAEIGIIGFLLEAVLIVGVLAIALRSARQNPNAAVRCIAAASLAGLSAVLLHSLVDFNLYIPANAMVFGWIAGLAASSDLFSVAAPATERHRMPRVLDVEVSR